MSPGKGTMVFMQNAEPISLYCGDDVVGVEVRAVVELHAFAQAADPDGDVVVGLAAGGDARLDRPRVDAELAGRVG